MANATYTNVIPFPVLRARTPKQSPPAHNPATIEGRVALIMQGYREAMTEMLGADLGEIA